jgi:diphthamide synthase subunit DPH2
MEHPHLELANQLHQNSKKYVLIVMNYINNEDIRHKLNCLYPAKQSCA